MYNKHHFLQDTVLRVNPQWSYPLQQLDSFTCLHHQEKDQWLPNHFRIVVPMLPLSVKNLRQTNLTKKVCVWCYIVICDHLPEFLKWKNYYFSVGRWQCCLTMTFFRILFSFFLSFDDNKTAQCFKYKQPRNLFLQRPRRRYEKWYYDRSVMAFVRMGMEFIHLVMMMIAIILLNYDTLIFIALILADINDDDDDNDDFTTSTISISQKTE